MGIISWIILGLIVGVLAKWIMPGKDPGGIFITIIIGIVGAFLGGFIGSLIGLGALGKFSILNIILAIVGALILLGGYRLIKSQS
ncbi:MAG: membrane protein [Candidatus Entotheonella gemina]|uniref:Membrane protein n=1 Tax=Candidatus Entotheonella gemina TaxID=1429439 RepID=W4LS69_9BACT|nr:MAG: membrane protein [Candidatus Entotheonella gemina]